MCASWQQDQSLDSACSGEPFAGTNGENVSFNDPVYPSNFNDTGDDSFENDNSADEKIDLFWKQIGVNTSEKPTTVERNCHINTNTDLSDGENINEQTTDESQCPKCLRNDFPSDAFLALFAEILCTSFLLAHLRLMDRNNVKKINVSATYVTKMVQILTDL